MILDQRSWSPVWTTKDSRLELFLKIPQFETESLPQPKVLELIGQQAFEHYLHFQIQILKNLKVTHFFHMTQHG